MLVRMDLLPQGPQSLAPSLRRIGQPLPGHTPLDPDPLPVLTSLGPGGHCQVSFGVDTFGLTVDLATLSPGHLIQAALLGTGW